MTSDATSPMTDLDKAVERLAEVSNGASPHDVYGSEWCLDPALEFQSDLRALLTALSAQSAELAKAREVIDALDDLRAEFPDDDLRALIALARRAVGEGGEDDALIADLRRFHDDCTPGRMDYALSDGLAFALEKAINRLAAIRSPE